MLYDLNEVWNQNQLLSRSREQDGGCQEPGVLENRSSCPKITKLQGCRMSKFWTPNPQLGPYGE